MEVLHKYFSGFSEIQVEQFSGLIKIYSEWNEKINVISRKDMDNFYVHHVLHSLAIASQFTFHKNARVLDLGTGGGFPGIPLAIMFPDVTFQLADSINKKLTVVNAVADELGIHNINTTHGRAEDIRNIKFDVVVSRAVASLNDLWKWSRPLIKINKKNTEEPNGLICLKGGDLTAEIAQSTCKPYVWEIEKLFTEEYFKRKFLLYQPI
jgi:16S rRNA (guanine527-N7)-methyltransferase